MKNFGIRTPWGEGEVSFKNLIFCLPKESFEFQKKVSKRNLSNSLFELYESFYGVILDQRQFAIVERSPLNQVICFGIINGTFWDSILKCFTSYSQLKVTKKRNIWKKN